MTTQIPNPHRERLSTGHEVTVPLDLSFAMGGIVVPARRRALEDALPSELSAVGVAPGVGCVALVGIQYHRVGTERAPVTRANAGSDRTAVVDSSGGLEPYDEFAVIVPAAATRRRGRTRAIAPLLGETVGGFVHWLPVTTEPAVALGRECWGYPKERATITVSDSPQGVRTTVERPDGGRCQLRVPRRHPNRRRRRQWSLSSFTTMDGTLLETTAEIRGEMTSGPAMGATLSWSDDLEPLSTLGLWNRPLWSFTGSRVRARLYEGTPALDD